jgi:L-alanine-DL-glutamate epimerase-like enolase superfamily enzyme
MDQIKKISFRPIARPLRTLFSTSLGQKSVMRSVLVKVFLEDTEGFSLGEVPTSFVLKEETVPRIQEILKEVSKEFTGLPLDEYEEKIPALRKRYPDNPMTVSGLETALFRAWLKSEKSTEHKFWGRKLHRLETDITIPFITDKEPLRKWMEYILKIGFKTYKLKVSGKLEEDREIISVVHSLLRDRLDSFEIRIDGNQGFTPKTFFSLTDWLEKNKIPIELVEQPFPKKDYAGYRKIRGRCPMPVILDESVFCYEDVERVIDQNLGDGINIKFAKSGISESRRMIRLAQKHKLKLRIGCMTETMVGLSAGIYCAMGTGAFDYIDLDGVYFLHHKNTYDQIKIYGPEFIIN